MKSSAQCQVVAEDNFIYVVMKISSPWFELQLVFVTYDTKDKFVKKESC